jgi:hypothetical protein
MPRACCEIKGGARFTNCLIGQHVGVPSHPSTSKLPMSSTGRQNTCRGSGAALRVQTTIRFRIATSSKPIRFHTNRCTTLHYCWWTRGLLRRLDDQTLCWPGQPRVSSVDGSILVVVGGGDRDEWTFVQARFWMWGRYELWTVICFHIWAFVSGFALRAVCNCVISGIWRQIEEAREGS